MKNYFIFSLLLCMLTVSCAKVSLENDGQDYYGLKSDEVLFSGRMEAYPSTKSVPGSDGNVVWSSSDEIGVYDGTSYVKATILNVSGDRIDFKATVDAGADKYVAVCPYSAVEDGSVTISDGKILLDAVSPVQKSGNQIVSVASIDAGAGQEFTFRNVVNLLTFRISKPGVMKAVLKGNADEQLAGKMLSDPETGEGLIAPEEGESGLKEITVDINTTGENYIAIAPDTKLATGFTITFFGDEQCTDYMGEVKASNALTMERNRIVDLGKLDGRIDNWKLWNAGKSIEIAGQTYSMESTGFAGTLLEATETDIDLYQECNGKSGIFFLESADDHRFVCSNAINVRNLILVGRYDMRKELFAPTTAANAGAMSLVGENGNLIVKGLRFDLSNGHGIRPFTAKMNDVHIDNCEIYIPDEKKFFVIINNAALVGPKSFKLVNSNITTSAVTGLVRLFGATYNSKLDTWDSIFIDNNIFYSKTYTQGFTLFYTPKTDAPESGTQKTEVTLTRNTFYNMMPHSNNFSFLYAYSMGGLTVRNNIFYNGNASAGARRFAYVIDKSSTFLPEFENNIVSSGTDMSYFNPNGYCPDSGIFPAASEIFSIADVENAIFLPVNNYDNYGAQR